MPKSIDELILDIVQRITNNGNAIKAVNLLFLLAEAKNSLSYSTVAEFLKMNKIQSQALIEKCGELLKQDVNDSGEYEFQLFHEYVREWFE